MLINQKVGIMMKKIIQALCVSTGLWCIAVACGYLAEVIKIYNTVHFSPQISLIGRLVLGMIPWIVLGVIAVNYMEQRTVSKWEPIVFLCAAVVAYVLLVKLHLPIYYAGARLEGSLRVFYPPESSALLQVAMTTLTALVYWRQEKKR